jgi:hypothetical protein
LSMKNKRVGTRISRDVALVNWEVINVVSSQKATSTNEIL